MFICCHWEIDFIFTYFLVCNLSNWMPFILTTTLSPQLSSMHKSSSQPWWMLRAHLWDLNHTMITMNDLRRYLPSIACLQLNTKAKILLRSKYWLTQSGFPFSSFHKCHKPQGCTCPRCLNWQVCDHRPVSLYTRICPFLNIPWLWRTTSDPKCTIVSTVLHSYLECQETVTIWSTCFQF